jgi:hypothetical protein
MNKQILGFLIPIAGIFAISSPASALSSIVSQSYGPTLNPSDSSSAPASGSVSISQFNSALGTLNSINVEFTGTTTFTVDGTNLGGSGSEIAGVTSATQNTTLTTPDLSLNLIGTSTATGFTDTSIPDGGSVANLVTVSGSPNIGSSFDVTGSISGTSLSQFIGSSSSKISLSLFGNATPTPDGNNTADFLSIDSLTSTSGTVKLTYNYTAPVPFDISADQLVFSLVPLFFGIRVIKKKIAK